MPLYSVRKGKVVEDQTVLSDLKYTKVSPTYKLPDKVSVNVEIGKCIYCYNWLILHSLTQFSQLTVCHLFLFITDNIIIKGHQSHETFAVLETCMKEVQHNINPCNVKVLSDKNYTINFHVIKEGLRNLL